MSEKNIEVKLDVSDSVNQIAKNAFNKPSTALGNTMGTVLEFFNNTVLLPMQKYNIRKDLELENYKNELEEKLKAIPEENLVEPKINIIGPSFEALRYNMEEEELKNMFTNLIIKSANSTTQSRVLPAYVDIIKQLSVEDAKMLTLFKENDFGFRTIQLTLSENNSDGHSKLDKYALITKSLLDKPSTIHSIKLNGIIIDNLIRLNLVELSFEEWYTRNIELYDKLFNAVANSIIHNPNQTLNYKKGILKLTDFGKNFIDICLS